jgi:hypothetical protein
MNEAATLLRELSEPWSSGEYVKTAIDRAARLASLTYWRAFDIWYGKARRVEEFELDQIRDALRIKNEKAAKNEFHDLKLRLAKLESALSASSDPDFHRPSIDFAREQMREFGRNHRPLDRKR